MNKAVFLDRDGVLIRDDKSYYVYKLEEFELLPKVPQALKLLSGEYKLIVVTNQGGVAKGVYSLEQYQAFSNMMEKELGNYGIKLDAIYVCPHPENVCECRKPKPGMMLQAANEHDIDFNQSWLIGDKISDVMAGQAAGCKTILVKTGAGKKDESALKATPDYEANDLLQAAETILAERNLKLSVL